MFLIHKEFIQILKIQTDKQAQGRNKVFMLNDIPTGNKTWWENGHLPSNKEVKIEVFKNNKIKAAGEDGCEVDRFIVLLVVCGSFGEQYGAAYEHMPYSWPSLRFLDISP